MSGWRDVYNEFVKFIIKNMLYYIVKMNYG